MTAAATRLEPTTDDVVYLDNSYTNTVGHNRPYLDAVVREFECRGTRVLAYVHRRLPDMPETQPAPPHSLRRRFRVYAPEFQASLPRWLPSKVQSVLGLLAGNLDAFIGTFRAGRNSPGATIIVANSFASNLVGTYLSIRALAIAGCGPRALVVVVHNRPSPAVTGLFRRAICALNRTVDLRVVVHAERNSDVADGCSVALLPLPYVRIRNVRHRVPEQTTFGFLGVASEAKGFTDLVDAIAAITQQDGRARFLIQANPRPEAATERAVEELRRLADTTDAVELLEGPLDDIGYDRAFEQVDVMLLPHRASAYATDESGVFLECVASGMPVIASHGTAMGARVARSDAVGWLFEDSDVTSLAAAILRATLDDHGAPAGSPMTEDPAERFANLVLADVAGVAAISLRPRPTHAGLASYGAR